MSGEILFTNFAAGELSDNLFGRIDIPFYHAGVSHLANFDVIPTGGIQRRKGSKRMGTLGGPCRLIPFIINEQYSFILEFGVGSIKIWNNGALIPGAVFTTYGFSNADGTETNAALSDIFTAENIFAIQYAQNYDRMVFVHRDFPPLMLDWGGNDGTGGQSFSLVAMNFDFHVTREVNDPYGQYDTSVSLIEDQEFYLGEAGYCPSAVAFFNSRLWFAGCQEKPQMVWASEAQDNETHYNVFSTFRRYITVTKVPSDQDIHIFSGKVVEGSAIITAVSQDYSSMVVDNNIISAGSGSVTAGSTTITMKRTQNAALEEYATITFKGTVDHEYYIIRVAQAEYQLLKNKLVGVKTTYYVISPYFPTGTSLRFIVGTGLPKVQVNTTKDSITGSGDTVVEIILRKSLDPIPSDWYVTAPGIPDDTLVTALTITDNEQYRLTLSKAATGTFNAATIIIGKYEEVPYFLSADGYFPYGTAVLAITATTITVSDPAYKTSGDEVYGGNMHYYPITMSIQRWKSANLPDENTDYEYKTEENDITVPSNAFQFEIASDQMDAIQWLGQNRNLIIGTESSEWIIPSGVNATNIQTMMLSRHGSADMQGISIGEALVFFAEGKKAVREYYYESVNEVFRSNNLAMFAAHMLHESPATDFDYVNNPYTRLIVTREDGAMVVLLYEKNTGSMAWGRCELGSGAVRSCATVPGHNGFDDVYVAVQDGSKYYLERIEEGAEVYLDGYQAYTPTIAGQYAGTDAVIYDYTDHKQYARGAADIPAGHQVFIGFPYSSSMQSLPVIAGAANGKKRITAVLFRFKHSWFPVITAVPDAREEHVTGHDEPFTGVIKVPFPGDYDRDVMYVLTTDKPEPCTALTVNVEVV